MLVCVPAVCPWPQTDLKASQGLEPISGWSPLWLHPQGNSEEPEGCARALWLREASFDGTPGVNQ